MTELTDATDLYAALNVPRDATTSDIRRAYRLAAQAAHPDHGGTPEQWERVRLAHDVLTDDARRAAYDDTGVTAEPPRDMRMGKAMEMMSHALDKALADVSATQATVARIDVVALMRRVLVIWQDEAQAMLVKLNAAIGLRALMRGRFHTATADNLLEGLVGNHIEALERQREQVTANLETARYATELLAGFSYRTDATQQQAAMQALFWQQMQTGLGG